MTRLEWNTPGDKRYQAGIDRGVFYTKKEGRRGVAWNGITDVKVSSEGALLTPVFLDGHVRAFDISPGRFKAVLDCLNYPDEFAEQALGERFGDEDNGLALSNQEIGSFDLSWRSHNGDDISGSLSSYKIHVLYDAYALPSEYTYSTVSDSTEPATFSFDIDAVPQMIDNRLPTAHFVIDTRAVPRQIVEEIEAILYGSEVEEPRMVSFDEIEAIISQEPPTVAANIAPRPVIVDGVPSGGWSSYDEDLYEVTRLEVDGREGRGCVLAERLDSDPSPVIGIVTNIGATSDWVSDAIPVEASSHDFSVYIRCSRIDWEARLVVQFYDDADSLVNGLDIGFGPSSETEEWIRPILHVDTPANATKVVFIAAATTLDLDTNADPGDQVWFCDAQIEPIEVEEGAERPPTSEFFYGDTEDQTWTRYVWEGEPHSSPSLKKSWD